MCKGVNESVGGGSDGEGVVEGKNNKQWSKTEGGGSDDCLTDLVQGRGSGSKSGKV